jgi:hypothetical protein
MQNSSPKGEQAALKAAAQTGLAGPLRAAEKP